MKSKYAGMDYSKYGYFFSIPFVLAFALFSLYPTFLTAYLGFTNRQGLVQAEYGILDNPFDNFKTILSSDIFKLSLKNTIQIWMMNFAPQIIIALLLTAWFTSHAIDLKGKGFFKVVFYMPNIITAATVAILFRALFDYPMSPVNDLLLRFGREEAFYFMNNKQATRLIVAFIQFWMWYGNTMIVLVSGVLGISPDIYEAAQIDGANGVQTFFLITIPNLKTILLYNLVTSLVGGLNMYDIPKLLRDGGPDNATLTTSVYIYNQAFMGSYKYNTASAASMVMFVIIAICSAILFYILRDKDEARLEKERKAKLKEAKRRGY